MCNLAYMRAYRARRKAAGNPVTSGKCDPVKKACAEKARRTNPAVLQRRANTQRVRYYSEAFRQRRDARQQTKNALRRGDITPQPCEKCGVAKAEAHHDDYTKPLDVRWLCRRHHREHHAAAKVTP